MGSIFLLAESSGGKSAAAFIQLGVTANPFPSVARAWREHPFSFGSEVEALRLSLASRRNLFALAVIRPAV
jgi:hypothetical protein